MKGKSNTVKNPCNKTGQKTVNLTLCTLYCGALFTQATSQHRVRHRILKATSKPEYSGGFQNVCLETLIRLKGYHQFTYHTPVWKHYKQHQQSLHLLPLSIRLLCAFESTLCTVISTESPCTHSWPTQLEKQAFHRATGERDLINAEPPPSPPHCSYL